MDSNFNLIGNPTELDKGSHNIIIELLDINNKKYRHNFSINVNFIIKIEI